MRLKLSAEKRKQEARAMLDRIDEFRRTSGFDDHVRRMSNWDVQWRAAMPRLNKPWDHASDYNPPLTWSKVEDVHAILFSFFSNFDFFSLAPAETRGIAYEMVKERAESWTAMLRWSLQNESCVIPVLDEFIHDGLTFGCGFIHTPWERTIRQIRSELFIPDELREIENIPEKDLIKLSMGDMLLKGPKRNGNEGGYAIIFTDDDGEERSGTAFVDKDNPLRADGEQSIFLQRDHVEFNAPAPEVVAPWDMMVPPHAKGLQKATRFHVRRHMTYDEIARLVNAGVFNTPTEPDLRYLREVEKATTPSREASEYDAVDTTRDRELSGQKLISRSEGDFEIFFEYAFEDVDKDGFAESIIRAVVNVSKPVLVMRVRLEELFPGGRRPFADWHCVPVDHRYYGMGLPEILEGSQKEENAYYQARSDVLEIITKPAGMYDPMSGLAPSNLRVTPGTLVKVRDVRTAYAPFTFAANPGFLLSEQSGIEMQAERAIGSTDMGLGRGPSRPNAPRTLGGTAIMVRQQQFRTDVLLKRVMYGRHRDSGVKEMLHQCMGLYRAFMPREKEFRIAGTDEIRKVQRADLQGRFDFVLDFGAEINNPQLKLQNALLRYQNSLQNPIVMQDPRLQWLLLKDFWEATGISNAAQSIPKPPGAQGHPPMEQEDECGVMARGIAVDVLPTDDHGQHLAYLSELLQDPPRLAEMFSPAELNLVGEHAQKHWEMMAAAVVAHPGPAGQSPQGPGMQSSPSQGMAPSMSGGAPSPMETVAGPTG